FIEIFKDLKEFYNEYDDSLVYFNDKIVFNDIRKKREELISNFLLKITKTYHLWSNEEIEELKFAKRFYNKYSDELELYDIYKNYVFSFHLLRTYKAFKIKFYKIEEEYKEFKIFKMKSRFKFIEDLLKKRLSKQFRKEYMFLVYQDSLRINLLE